MQFSSNPVRMESEKGGWFHPVEDMEKVRHNERSIPSNCWATCNPS